MRQTLRRQPIAALCSAVAAALVATTLAVLPLRAQSPTPAQLARLDPSTRTAVVGIADSAVATGIPAGPLYNKALEGASKHADGARILLAVRSLARELATARAALGPASSDAELVAGAAALHAGIPMPTLSRLRVRHRSVATPLAVMSDLVARGVSADSAGGIVLALATADLPDDALLTFQRNVERDIALGAPPSAAASVRGSAAGIVVGFADNQLARKGPAARRRP